MMPQLRTITPETLNQELRALRLACGFTLNDVCERSGLSVSYLSDIERGRTMPSMKTLGKLAAAFGATVAITFVYDTDEPPPFAALVPYTDLEAHIEIMRDLIETWTRLQE